MVLQDIQLAASDSNWRLFMLRKADSAFLNFQHKVHIRDQFSCQYCGFKSKEHLEVINADGNYRNNRIDNLVTACQLCAQCFFLESIGKGDFGGGTLIYLPEMTQGQLNAMIHVLFTNFALNSFSTEARNIYRGFKLRSQPVEKILGEGMSNAALFGRLWVDANLNADDSLQKNLLVSLRLLPELSRFTHMIHDQVASGLQELTVDERQS